MSVRPCFLPLPFPHPTSPHPLALPRFSSPSTPPLLRSPLHLLNVVKHLLCPAMVRGHRQLRTEILRRRQQRQQRSRVGRGGKRIHKQGRAAEVSQHDIGLNNMHQHPPQPTIHRPRQPFVAFLKSFLSSLLRLYLCTHGPSLLPPSPLLPPPVPIRTMIP